MHRGPSKWWGWKTGDITFPLCYHFSGTLSTVHQSLTAKFSGTPILFFMFYNSRVFVFIHAVFLLHVIFHDASEISVRASLWFSEASLNISWSIWKSAKFVNTTTALLSWIRAAASIKRLVFYVASKTCFGHFWPYRWAIELSFGGFLSTPVP